MNAETREALLAEAERLWSPGQPRPAAYRTRPAAGLTFSVMFFSASGGDGYDLVHRAAERADALGFAAVWVPERHFHDFGGPYPEPAVLAASLARCTTRIRLRAGSVVLPLHHPAAVAERWAMVDALSGGRVEVAFGSGWNPNDFLLAPAAFPEARAILRRDVDIVRRLWRGEAVAFPNGDGILAPVRTYPRPVQPELPVWVSSTGSRETFEWAGAQGFDILTMLIAADLDGLADRITAYRAARQAAGHDPAAGRVALMLHTLVHPDGARVAAAVRDPFMAYVRNSLDVQAQGHAEGATLTEAQREQMVAFAYERYTRTAALFGTPAACQALLDRVAASGVDEIACLIDFGVPDDLVLEGLDTLAAMRGLQRAAVVAEPIAIIGMHGRFPGAPDLGQYWANLRDGVGAVTLPPPGRGTALVRGGFLADIEAFDAAAFGIAPAEAAAMDPHHRLLLASVQGALADAGHADDLRGAAVGVFAAMYSTSHAASRPPGAPLDGIEVAGQMASMAANRVSFSFDWSGPSEVVNTACSSGLVALHRAAAALRAGECTVAVAAGVSLLLSDAESAALAGMGVLSPRGACRAFDRDADGQVRGEGVGALVLKPLFAALRDGDTVLATLRGSAVNHGGNRGMSLTLPNPTRQAACMNAALAQAGMAAEAIGYVEAHGAGTSAGDLAEAGALERVFPAGVAVGSVKPSIGALDAAGGIASVIKTVLALRHAAIPGMLNHANPPEHLVASRLRFPPVAEPWPGERRALVHAYGLGGVNAALVLEAHGAPVLAPVPAVMVGVDVVRANDGASSVVASFYDFVARPEMARREIYLTLAPFAEIVPGFSWTRTFQDPDGHPEHWARMLAAQREMRDALFAHVSWARVARVLDFGCGVGTDLAALAARYPTLEGVGFTISPDQATLGQGRLAAAGLGNRVTILNKDSAQDQFPGAFDLVFGFEVAHHVRDKDALFANIAGHLAPGGLLVLADNLACTVAPVDLPQLGSWTLDQAGYADLFTRHGLRIVDCIDCSPQIANFLADPALEPMLDAEQRAAHAAGRDGFTLAAAVQRSWHAFGEALSSGLMAYVLLTAERAAGDDGLSAHNRRQVGME